MVSLYIITSIVSVYEHTHFLTPSGDVLFSFFVAVREEISGLDTRYVFGSGLDLDLLGIEIDDNTLIPGLAVGSSRAKPLAGAFFFCISIAWH